MGYRRLTIDELLKELDKYSHTELHVHHTWLPNHSMFTGSNHVKLQDGMRNYHMGANGWNDIAQHVTLFPDGTFLTGRNFASQPVSIKGYNGSDGRYPFCLEMIGDFDKGQDKLEGKQKSSALQLAKYFDDKKKYVRFHRENAPWKSCPGTGIDKAVFMKEARAFTKAPVKTAVETKPIEKESNWLMEPIKFDSSEINNAVARVLGRFERKEPALGKEWRKSFLDGTMKGKDLLGLAYVGFDRGYITGLNEENVNMIVQKVIAELKKGE